MNALKPPAQDYSDAAKRVIVALDVLEPREALATVERLRPQGCLFKVGLQLAHAGGLELARELIAEGIGIFIDLKLHDISMQVEAAVVSLARLNPTFITVHAFPQTMRAARAGLESCAPSDCTLLAVSVLTSMTDHDLDEAGYRMGVKALVERRARQALDAGMGGMVCAPTEARLVRSVLGPHAAIVTPGVRPLQASADDQRRVATPLQAIREGASHIVVGRPIRCATDPELALRNVIAQVKRATD